MEMTTTLKMVVRMINDEYDGDGQQDGDDV
jgi:hypothetical protein